MKANKEAVSQVKAAQRNRVASHLAHFEILGEVVCWDIKTGISLKHAMVIQALKDSMLDPDVLRKLLPRYAFTRASKTLTDERMITVLREEGEVLTFQLNRKVMEGEVWDFPLETKLALNKITGVITCDIPQVQALAQKELDRCMEERTTADISNCIQKLFEKDAALFPLRDNGGVYFVPKEHLAFVDKVQNFLGKVNAELRRLPVPAGTQQGDRAVAASVADAMGKLIVEHEEAVKEFSIHTRQDTIAHRVEKIKETRVRIEAYANYLGEQQANLLKNLEEMNEKLKQQVHHIAERKADSTGVESNGSSRLLLFGQTITSVLRAMGKENWKFDEAEKALGRMSVSVAAATIRAQLLAGRKGDRGDPALLTKKQWAELKGESEAA